MDARVKPTAVRHGLCLMECTALILLGSRSLRINWTRERTNAVQHQNIVFHGILKHVPWALFDRLVEQYHADPDPRGLKTKAHLIAMLYGQLCGSRGLREIETNLRSHASKLYHLGGCTVSRSALATANASRPVEVFAGLLSALMGQLQRGYRRKIGDCVRLIDSTSVQLSSLSGNWATFSAGVCGAKAHIIYDPDADQPLYLMVTAANVNDITAAKEMPIEPGATYVFDLGYYDYGDATSGQLPHCNAAQSQYSVCGDRGPAAADDIVDPERPDRIPPEAARRLPQQPDVGPRARSPGRDRDRQGVAHLHQRSDRERRRNRRLVQASLGHRAVLSMGQTGLENQSLLGSLRECRPHSDCGRADCFSAAALGP